MKAQMFEEQTHTEVFVLPAARRVAVKPSNQHVITVLPSAHPREPLAARSAGGWIRQSDSYTNTVKLWIRHHIRRYSYEYLKTDLDNTSKGTTIWFNLQEEKRRQHPPCSIVSEICGTDKTLCISNIHRQTKPLIASKENPWSQHSRKCVVHHNIITVTEWQTDAQTRPTFS